MAEVAATHDLPRLSLRGLRRGAGLAISRGAAVAAQMAVQVAVGFVSGPTGIGLLQLHMAWSSLAGELVGGGEASRTLRDTSIRHERGQDQAIRQSLRRALLRIMGFSAALAVAVGLALYLTDGLLASTSIPPLLIATVLIAAPLFAVGRVCAESLKGLADPLAAVTLENLVLPTTILLVCGAMALGIIPANGEALLIAATLGVVLTVLFLAQRFRQRMTEIIRGRSVDRSVRDDDRSDDHGLGGGAEQAFLWMNGLLNIGFLQLPFLLLPWFVDAAEIGRFAVAHKLVNIITTLLILLAAVYGPRFAKAAAARNTAELAKLLRQTQQISLVLFTPTWALLLAAAQPLGQLLSLEAGALGPILLILGCGQLANAATGLSGVLLSMSGGARREFQILLLSALATLGTALALAITHEWNPSLEHVALAIAGGITLRNVLSYVSARRHTLHLRTLK